MFHKRFFKSLLLFFLFFGIATCTSTKPLIKNTVLSSTTNLPLTNSTNADSQLKIWWNQGFLPEENEFITQIVDEWKQQNNIDVELSLIADRNINQEARKAIDADKTPDIVFNFTGDLNLFHV
jgi:multiple sugar transport system substrate-binding protein